MHQKIAAGLRTILTHEGGRSFDVPGPQTLVCFRNTPRLRTGPKGAPIPPRSRRVHHSVELGRKRRGLDPGWGHSPSREGWGASSRVRGMRHTVPWREATDLLHEGVRATKARPRQGRAEGDAMNTRKKKDKAPRGVFRHPSGDWAIRFFCGQGHKHLRAVSGSVKSRPGARGSSAGRSRPKPPSGSRSSSTVNRTQAEHPEQHHRVAPPLAVQSRD
jgi:hypothetical protein